jgi:chromosome condensin MukBEF complex kleisin-like MukF subunit
MSINISELAQSILAAASGAAKGHAADLKNYLEARAKLIAQGVATLASDRLSGKINDDDVRFAFDEIKESEKSAAAAVAVTAKAAAQDAINAALNVAAAAVNKAAGIAIL